MTRADGQPFQAAHSHAHRSRSAGAGLGRFNERSRTPMKSVPDCQVLQLERASRFEGGRYGLSQQLST